MVKATQGNDDTEEAVERLNILSLRTNECKAAAGERERDGNLLG